MAPQLAPLPGARAGSGCPAGPGSAWAPWRWGDRLAAGGPAHGSSDHCDYGGTTPGTGTPLGRAGRRRHAVVHKPFHIHIHRLLHHHRPVGASRGQLKRPHPILACWTRGTGGSLYPLADGAVGTCLPKRLPRPYARGEQEGNACSFCQSTPHVRGVSQVGEANWQLNCISSRGVEPLLGWAPARSLGMCAETGHTPGGSGPERRTAYAHPTRDPGGSRSVWDQAISSRTTAPIGLSVICWSAWNGMTRSD